MLTTKLVGTTTIDGNAVEVIKNADGTWIEYDSETGEAKKDSTVTVPKNPEVTDVKVVAAKSKKSTVVTQGDGVTVTRAEDENGKPTNPADYTVSVAIDEDTMEMKGIQLMKMEIQKQQNQKY